MPRLSHHLILKAYNISSLLPLVIRGTRTLTSAINELRWLKEHVSSTARPEQCRRVKQKRLLQLCQRRSRAEPLQYILGSQPFGDLDIKCQSGVLIPRPETEAYTAYAAKHLINRKNHVLNQAWGPHDPLGEQKIETQNVPPLRILDLCTGSGCIPLLLHSLLAKSFKDIRIFGIDISETAVKLANENLTRNVKAGNLLPPASQKDGGVPPDVQFGIYDILDPVPLALGRFDLMISNPPYISKSKFVTDTTRSVRDYEPRLALVPSHSKPFTTGWYTSPPEDIFYKKILQTYDSSLSQMLIMEIGDEEQAHRVVMLALAYGFFSENKIEIWRDWPDLEPGPGEATAMRIEGLAMDIHGRPLDSKLAKKTFKSKRAKNRELDSGFIDEMDIPIKGAGKMRTVVLCRSKVHGPVDENPEMSSRTLADLMRVRRPTIFSGDSRGI